MIASLKVRISTDNKDVIVGYEIHQHYICGTATTSVCQHIGIASHSEADIIEYRPISIVYNGVIGTFPTKGQWYLDTDLLPTSRVEVVLTGDIKLCLNGHTMSMIVFSPGPTTASTHRLSITNCQNKIGVIETNENPDFNISNGLDIISSEAAPILFKYCKIGRAVANAVDWKFYNVVFDNQNDLETSNHFVNLSYTSGDNNRLTMSSVSIANYRTGSGITMFTLKKAIVNLENVTIKNTSVIGAANTINCTDGGSSI